MLKRTALIGTVIALSLLLATAVLAQPRKRGHEQPMPGHGMGLGPLGLGQWWNDPNIQGELGLTGDQVKALDDAWLEFDKAKDALRLDIQQAKLDIERAFSEEKIDAKKVDQIAKRLASLEGKATELLIAHKLKVAQILSYEQRQKLKRITAGRFRHGGGDFMGPGAEPGPDPLE